MRGLVWNWAWSAIVVASVCAQDDLRTSRVFGVALREDGSPWVGATILLAPDAARDGLPPRIGDTRRVQTDAHGRFAFDVLPARPCLLWAIGSQAAGRARVSSEVLQVDPGARAELHADPDLREPTRFRVRMPDPVPAQLFVERIEATTRCVTRHQLGFDISAALPACVRGPVTYRLLDAQDRLIAQVEDPGVERDVELVLPALRPVEVRLGEAPANLPLAGVPVEAEIGLLRGVLGLTDENGIARVVPVLVGSRTKAGFRLVPAPMVVARAGILPVTVRTAESAVTEVVIPPIEVAPHPVHFLVDGRAIARTRMRAMVSVSERRSASSRSVRFDECFLATDASGAIAFDAPVGARIDLEIECDESLLRALPPGWREGAPARILFGFVLDATLQSIDLTESMRAIELGLLGPDGTPIAGAAVGIAPRGGGVQQTLTADRAGVVRFFVPVDHSTPTLVIVAGACGAGVMQVGPGADPEHPLDVAHLRATLFPVVQVRVQVGAGAQPAMPAHVEVMAQWFPSKSEQPAQFAAASNAESDSSFLGAKEPTVRVLDESATIRHLPKLLSSRGSDGKVTVFGVPALGGRIELRARGDTPRGVVWAKTAVDLDAEREVTTVELGFPK